MCIQRGFRNCALRTALADVVTYFSLFVATFIISTPVTHADTSSIDPDTSLITVRSKINDQIESAPVHSTIIDKFGYLWLTTERAVYRVGGELFEKYGRLEDGRFSIPAPHIDRIFSSPSGDIFLGTRDTGVFQWDGLNATFEKKDVSLPGVEDESPNLYGVIHGGLLLLRHGDTIYLYDNQSEQRHIIISDLNPNPDFDGIISYANGHEDSVYISTGSQLLSISVDNSTRGSQITILAQGKVRENITALFFDERSFKIIAGSKLGEIYEIEPKTLTALHPALLDIGEPNQIYSVATDQDSLVVASRLGLYSIDKAFDKDFSNIRGATRLLDSIIYDINSQGETHWISTYDGLYLLSSTHIRRYDYKNSGIDGDVLSFYGNKSDGRWVGTSKGLYKFDYGLQEHIAFSDLEWKEPLPRAEVTTMDAYRDDLWLGFHDGSVRILHTKDERITSIELEPSIPVGVTHLAVGDEGSNAFVGTFGGGLYRASSHISRPISLSGTAKDQYIHRVFLNTDESSFVLAESSIFFLPDEQLHATKIPIRLPDYATSARYNSLVLASESTILLGTDSHGVFRLDINLNSATFETTAPTQLGKGTRLENAIIYSMEIEKNGSVWISTDTGIFYLDLTQDKILRFTESDGLQSNEFTFGSSYIDTDGLIYFGGAKGYNVVNSRRLLSRSFLPPDVAFFGFSSSTSDEIQDLSFLETPKIVLSHKDASFTTYFGVIDARSFRENIYRVVMNGGGISSTVITEVGNASFSDIPWGSYQLVVQAANSYGVWDQVGTKLDITILPPPWRTWWAYCTYLIAGLLSLWVVHRIYYSYIAERRSQELTIEIEETRNRAEDEIQEQLEFHDELARAAHQHHGSILKLLQRCLNETLSGSENAPSPESVQASPNYLQALSLLEDCTIYDEGEVSINLRVFVEKLFPAIMPYCRVDPATIITVNEVKADPITLEIGTTLGVIIYELARNAITHAYPQSSPANYLRVISRVEYDKETDSESLVIIVRDSGEGIPDDAIETAAPGSGIALVQSLAANIGAEFSYSYSKGTMAKVTLKDSQSNPIFA